MNFLRSGVIICLRIANCWARGRRNYIDTANESRVLIILVTRSWKMNDRAMFDN